MQWIKWPTKLTKLWVDNDFLGHKRELFKFLLNMKKKIEREEIGNHKVGQMDTYLYDVDSGIPSIF